VFFNIFALDEVTRVLGVAYKATLIENVDFIGLIKDRMSAIGRRVKQISLPCHIHPPKCIVSQKNSVIYPI